MIILLNEGMPRHDAAKTKELFNNKRVMFGQHFSLVINNYSGSKCVSLISMLVSLADRLHG